MDSLNDARERFEDQSMYVVDQRDYTLGIPVARHLNQSRKEQKLREDVFRLTHGRYRVSRFDHEAETISVEATTRPCCCVIQ